MKQYISIIVVLLLLVIGFFIGGIVAKRNDPVLNDSEIVFDTYAFNFGTIKKDTVAKYSFQFFNKGLDGLKIRKLIPYCGCTIANYPKDIVAPGDSAFIEVSFTPYKRGVFNKNIEVKTNSKNNSIVYLSIEGKVI